MKNKPTITEGDFSISSFMNYANGKIKYGVQSNPIHESEKEAEQFKQRILQALKVLDEVKKEIEICHRSTCVRDTEVENILQLILERSKK